MNAINKMKTSHKLKPRLGCDMGSLSGGYNSSSTKDAYYGTFGLWPSIYQLSILNPKRPDELFRWATKEGFTLDVLHSASGRSKHAYIFDDSDKGSYALIHSARKLLLTVLVPTDNKGDMRIIMFCPANQWSYTKNALSYLSISIGSDAPTGNIHLLAIEQGDFSLMPLSIDKPVMDLRLNYGHRFMEIDSKLHAFIKEKNSGLILFHGVTGSGKSTYIYHLIHSTDQKVIYIPNNVISQITNPGFLPFLITEAKESVIVVEDAEAVLLKRDKQGDSGVSTLLNITDGILGRLLKCKVICTFNIERTQLDDALLRKGRLSIEHEFNKLNAPEANMLFQYLGSQRRTDIPLTLAEIYNDDGGRETTDNKIIGFNK